MYKDFLEQELSTNVRDTFNELMTASEKHQASFERSADRIGARQDGRGNGRTQNNNRGSGYGNHI